MSKENDSAQTATVGSDKTLFVQYNAESSKVYYAEATFTADVEARKLIGMTHSVKGDTERYLIGYKGRTAVHEIMRIDKGVKNDIVTTLNLKNYVKFI